MREIKFRAWEPRFKNMWSHDEIYIYKGRPRFNSDYDHVGLAEDGILMQYTGLHDKNGREIFEGDIVKTANGRVLEVSYNIPWTSFILTNKYRQCDCERLGSYCTELLFEVIGNIYENPELLKAGDVDA